MENKISSVRVELKEYAKKVIEITKNHFKKYSNKKMTLQELDALCKI